jgi:hypothetical protein
MSKNPFSLYESVPGWSLVSKEISDTITAARNNYVGCGDTPGSLAEGNAKEAFKLVNAVLRRKADYGANDTESRWAACKQFCAGFKLDPDDFY